MKPLSTVHRSLRFSLGSENPAAEIREATAAVPRCLATLGGVR